MFDNTIKKNLAKEIKVIHTVYLLLGSQIRSEYLRKWLKKEKIQQLERNSRISKAKEKKFKINKTNREREKGMTINFI